MDKWERLKENINTWAEEGYGDKKYILKMMSELEDDKILVSKAIIQEAYDLILHIYSFNGSDTLRKLRNALGEQ